jgi:hypothetical protein
MTANTQKAPSKPRIVLTILLCTIAVLPAITAWLILPEFRDWCIRRAVEQSAGRSFWWPPSWRQELNTTDRLLQPVSIQFVGTPFGEVISFLNKFMKMPVQVNLSLQNQPAPAETPVTIALENSKNDREKEIM